MHGQEPRATGPLCGVTVIEMASFVAGPSAGLALAQLGATVVRVDPLGGAADINRWPVDGDGHSIYWPALNRSKRSVAIDVRTDLGREAVSRLVCAPGPERGIFITNVAGQEWAAWPALSARRPDLIHVHIEGHRDGRPAVDYTVNAEVGVPLLTGPEATTAPINAPLPAWDFLTGMTTTTALLAALRHRDQTGEGAHLNIALADVALAGIANLGWLTEAHRSPIDRERHANNVYGTYGREFATADGRHVMIVALTPKHWKALVDLTGASAAIAKVETDHDVDLTRDEAARYRLRDLVSAAFAPWFAANDLAEITWQLDGARVLWSPYRTLRQAAAAMEGPLAMIDQPGIGPVISAESPIRWEGMPSPVIPASTLGADTVATLQELGGLSDIEIAELAAAGVITSESSHD